MAAPSLLPRASRRRLATDTDSVRSVRDLAQFFGTSGAAQTAPLPARVLSTPNPAVVRAAYW